MQQLRIGIVGCGEVTQIIHLPSLGQLAESFAVTAVCDVSDRVVQSVGDRWSIAQRFHDYRDLVAQAAVDAVLVASPDVYHAEVALAAMAAGKHVLIEKPICMTLREADEIVQAQESAGVVAQIGYMRRYAPAFLEARRLLPMMGPIRLARVHDVLGWNSLIIQGTSTVIRGHDVPADVVAAGERLRSERIAEAIGNAAPPLAMTYGLLLGLCSHDVSAMRELLGMPKGVLYAAQRHGGMAISAAFDYGDFVCQFEAAIDNIPRFDAHLEVYGEERVLRVQYDTPYVRNLPIRLSITGSNGNGGVVERIEHPVWGDPFVNEWQAFYDNIVNHTEPRTSAADARQDLLLFQEMIRLMQ